MKDSLKTIYSFIIIVVIAFLLSSLVTRYLIASIPIEGSSMEPTIHNSDRVIVYRQAELKIGDIVIFYFEQDDKYLVKRVLGLAGDTIEIKADGEKIFVFRNGEKIEEPYIKEDMNYIRDKIVVGEGKFYYLGDNRNNSQDSHYGNLGDISQIVGVAFFRANISNMEFECL